MVWTTWKGARTYGAWVASVLVASCGASTAPPPDTVPSTTDPVVARGWAPGQPDLAARRATGQAEIGEALRALDVAGDACGSACPALADLRIGVAHMCALADTRDDEKICKESRARLLEIGTHIKATCGACKPAPDPDADDGGDPTP
jgi:hypothetical protein